MRRRVRKAAAAAAACLAAVVIAVTVTVPPASAWAPTRCGFASGVVELAWQCGVREAYSRWILWRW